MFEIITLSVCGSVPPCRCAAVTPPPFANTMTFYLKPPRGDIALDKLEDLAMKRWNFLKLLLEASIRAVFNVLMKHSPYIQILARL